VICPVLFTHELSTFEKAAAGTAGGPRLFGVGGPRKGKPSDRQVPVAKVKEMLGLYRDTYFDLNMAHFHEKLLEEQGMELSYTFVQKALQGAGLVARGRKRRKHRRRRSGGRCPACCCTSMAANIGGSATSARTT
jgi:hypothetical protein